MKKIFYIVILLFISLWWFTWFVMSQWIDNSLVDMELSKYYGIVSLLLNVHKEVWMWHSDDEIIESYSSLMQNIKYYADIDVLKYLSKTVYPEASMNNFLNKTQSILNTSNVFLLHLENKKNSLVQKKNNCDNAKDLSDKSFTLAVKDSDSAKIEKYLMSSIENEYCSVESRITYNAYDKMQAQIKYYFDILQKKYDYFYRNKYEIIDSLTRK